MTYAYLAAAALAPIIAYRIGYRRGWRRGSFYGIDRLKTDILDRMGRR